MTQSVLALREVMVVCFKERHRPILLVEHAFNHGLVMDARFRSRDRPRQAIDSDRASDDEHILNRTCNHDLVDEHSASDSPFYGSLDNLQSRQKPRPYKDEKKHHDSGEAAGKDCHVREVLSHLVESLLIIGDRAVDIIPRFLEEILYR